MFLMRGKPYSKSTAWTLFKKYAAKAGVPQLSFQNLRHTFASLLMCEGVPTRMVMEWGGWSDIAMLNTYSHMAPSIYDQEINILKGLLPSSLSVDTDEKKGLLEARPDKDSAQSRTLIPHTFSDTKQKALG